MPTALVLVGEKSLNRLNITTAKSMLETRTKNDYDVAVVDVDDGGGYNDHHTTAAALMMINKEISIIRIHTDIRTAKAEQ